MVCAAARESLTLYTPRRTTAPEGGLSDMVTVNCPAAPPETQLMRSEQDSLSIIYCLRSEALGFGVILESVQISLCMASVLWFRLNHYKIVSMESNVSQW